MNCQIPGPLPTHRPIVVRVVAPSGSLVGHEARIRAGIMCLESAGFVVQAPEGLSNRTYRGYLSGSDDLRLKELLGALTDDEVDIVWWARGGSGGARLLPNLLPELSKMKPKWLIGFSDATSILNAVSLTAKWVTIHGPTVSLLEKHPAVAQAATHLLNNINTLNNDTCVGHPVYGGNLTVLASLMGTLDLNTIGAHHLLIEDVNESPYRLDRALTQLRQAWPIEKLRSIWVGNLDLEDAETDSIIANLREDFGCPVYVGASAGHSGPLSLIPLGVPIAESQLSDWMSEQAL